MMSPTLGSILLGSPDPQRLCDWYCAAFDCTPTRSASRPRQDRGAVRRVHGRGPGEPRTRSLYPQLPCGRRARCRRPSRHAGRVLARAGRGATRRAHWDADRSGWKLSPDHPTLLFANLEPPRRRCERGSERNCQQYRPIPLNPLAKGRLWRCSRAHPRLREDAKGEVPAGSIQALLLPPLEFSPLCRSLTATPVGPRGPS